MFNHWDSIILRLDFLSITISALAHSGYPFRPRFANVIIYVGTASIELENEIIARSISIEEKEIKKFSFQFHLCKFEINFIEYIDWLATAFGIIALLDDSKRHGLLISCQLWNCCYTLNEIVQFTGCPSADTLYIYIYRNICIVYL